MPSSTPRDWGRHAGPPTPTGHLPPTTQALGASTHGIRQALGLSHHALRPKEERVVGGAREWQVGDLGVQAGFVGWGSLF